MNPARLPIPPLWRGWSKVAPTVGFVNAGRPPEESEFLVFGTFVFAGRWEHLFFLHVAPTLLGNGELFADLDDLVVEIKGLLGVGLD